MFLVRTRRTIRLSQRHRSKEQIAHSSLDLLTSRIFCFENVQSNASTSKVPLALLILQVRVFLVLSLQQRLIKRVVVVRKRYGVCGRTRR